MRAWISALAGFFVMCGAIVAQQPGFGQPTTAQQGQKAVQPQPFPKPNLPQPPQVPQTLPKLDPKNNPLDWVLVNWEKAMANVKSLAAELERTEINSVFKKKVKYSGEARYLKSANADLASLEMKRVGQPAVFEKYVVTGTFLYQYLPEKKEVHVHDMPKLKPGQKDEHSSFLNFFLGMGAARAKHRYNLRYLKYDKHYLYLEILPKSQQDKADFKQARLVLLRSNFLPRQLWFRDTNDSTTTWDVKRIESPARNVTVLEFQRPALPRGWQLRRVSTSQRPRLIRNQQ